MYLVESKGGAIALMIAALCFLGTWPAIMNGLERRGRLLQHTYLDYSITNFLGAVVFAFTLGQIGHDSETTPNFLTQLGQKNWPSVAFALAGGLVLSAGNLATQYGWPFVGLSATEVISSSFAVIVGTTMNYFLDGRINRAEILFPGVGCFLVAVCLGSALHASNSADNNTKLQLAHKQTDTVEAGPSEDLKKSTVLAHNSKHGTELQDMEAGKVESINAGSTAQKAASGSAEYLNNLNNKRAVKTGSSSYIFGLAIVFFAGLCFALFSPAFNLATNDQWHYLKPGVPHLVVYTAFFYFSCPALVFGFGVNLIFLYFPLLGLPKSSFCAYLRDWNGRKWAFLAGALCSMGNGLQFMGGQAAGYAAADAVQALPLVSTFWGILIFKEYHRSSRKTYVLLVSMIVMFIAAVAILASSSGHRK